MSDASKKSKFYYQIAERISAYLPPTARVFNAGGGVGAVGDVGGDGGEGGLPAPDVPRAKERDGEGEDAPCADGESEPQGREEKGADVGF